MGVASSILAQACPGAGSSVVDKFAEPPAGWSATRAPDGDKQWLRKNAESTDED
jgi:hypothetical protein